MEASAVDAESAPREAVGIASETERRTMLATLTRAFFHDPVLRWVFPADTVFERAFPALADCFGGGAIGHGTAFVAAGGAAAALWLPPGESPDDDGMKSVLVDHVSPGRLDLIQTFFDRLEPYHPQETHWYLTLIGVAPEHQGAGHGSVLLEHALRQCDAMRLPVFLEATSERNLGFYARNGFELMGEVQVDDSPVIRPMMRSAR